MYKTATEPIQQHTAVRYNCWLWRTTKNLLFQQTANNFWSSDAWSLVTSQVQVDFLAAFFLHSVESVEEVGGLE
jgi:DNA polymerase III psi subunit